MECKSVVKSTTAGKIPLPSLPMCYNCIMITNTVDTGGRRKNYDYNNECYSAYDSIVACFRHRSDSGGNNRCKKGELICFLY